MSPRLSRISVLEQVPLFEGGDARRTLEDLVVLGRGLEEAGYHRLWLAEHHSTGSFLSSAPDLLVGHSFGALVASTLAASLEKMGWLAGLVLLSPSGLGEEVNRDFLLSVIEAADDGALARALEALTVKHYRSSAAYVRAMRARLLAAQAQLYRLVDDVVDITGRQSRSIVETLASLSAPVTLVHGREDAVIPWQHALNAPPATALHLLPGIGHMPHWEAAALTTNIIIRAAAEAEGLRLAG